MSGHIRFLAAVMVLLASVGSAFAEDAVTLESLSQFERTIAQKLIDRLKSDSEQVYTDELKDFARDFTRLSLDTKPVLAVVKAAAGDRSQFLTKILDAECVAQGGAGNLCVVAKADQGAPNTNEISTAATVAGGAVGGAVSGTGSQGGISNSGSSGGSDSSVRNTPPSFSGLGGGFSGSIIDDGGTTFVTNTLVVPGPAAGAGLAGLLVLGACALKRRWSVSRHDVEADSSR